MRFIYIFFLLFFFTPYNIPAQVFDNKNLKQLIENDPAFSCSFVGVSVLDLEKDITILSYNGTKNFAPASVLKILYTMAAIDTKGEDFKYRTEVSYTGDILYDGTLQGDLIITSSGDPTLGSPRFYKNGYKTLLRSIKKALGRKGITCIDGDIILELTNQSYPVHGSWTVEDLGNYYAGGAWSFNFNDNEYRVKFKLDKSINSTTEIMEITPEIPGLKIINHVKTYKKGSGDNSYIYGLPYSYTREIKGTLPVGNPSYTIKGSIPNPPLTFLRIFADFLDDNDYYFSDYSISSQLIPAKKHLFFIKSPALLDIVKTCNNWSINLYSESLAKLLCLKSSHPHEYLSVDEIQSFFEKYNITSDKSQIVDGCGLSSMNHISPNKLNSFIKSMVHKIGLHTVLDILPKAGKEGYAKRITIPDLWIKSGSIQGVLNYSGVLKNKAGKYYIFTVFTNNGNKALKNKTRQSILNLIRSISRSI